MSDETVETQEVSDVDLQFAHDLLDELASAKAELKSIKARHDAVKTRVEQAERRNSAAFAAAQDQRKKK